MTTPLYNGRPLRAIIISMLDTHDVLTYKHVTDAVRGAPTTDAIAKTFSRIKYMGLCHVAAWERFDKAQGWCWTPVFKKGKGEDVPRPGPELFAGKRGKAKPEKDEPPAPRCPVIELWGRATTPNTAPAGKKVRMLGMPSTIWESYAQAA